MSLERELGQFPLSIGTSLAFEGLLGIHPDQKPHPPGFDGLRNIWVNLSTMSRNFLASMTRDQQKSFKMVEAAERLIQEVQQIPEIFAQHTRRQYKVVYYVEDLSVVNREFPHAKFYAPSTDRQKEIDFLQKSLLTVFLRSMDEFEIPYQTIRRFPPHIPEKTMILTHYGHQLLWHKQFLALWLLESHTGKMKPKSMFHTKLHYLKEEDGVPFNRFTLQVFGDNSFVIGQERSIRDEVKQLAKQRPWSHLTSDMKVRADINERGSQALKDLLRTMKI